MADIRYAIKRGKRWLQCVKESPSYTGSATAPTMGARHTFSEFQTEWGTEMVLFERLTAANCIKVLMEEYRWGDLRPMEFKVVCMPNGRNEND